MRTLILALDGVDSPYAGCTTHFATFLVTGVLRRLGVRPPFPPLLVRLNQFIPWKTRGNAAVAVHLEAPERLRGDDLLRAAAEALNRYSGGVVVGDPGLAVLDVEMQDDSQLELLKGLYIKALVDIVPVRLLEGLRRVKGLVSQGGRGLVGALAALGYALKGPPYTYELLVYRRPEYLGRPRCVKEGSVKAAESHYWGYLFNNYDFEEDRVVATPRGPDPVLIGLRGTSICVLLEAATTLELCEPPSALMLFRTNQHLDEHARPLAVSELRPFSAGYVEGVVGGKPHVIKKGHVFVKLRDETGSVTVAFFSPSRPMNLVAKELEEGDYIGVLGGAKPSPLGLLFEAHKLWVLETAPRVRVLNPPCPVCGIRLESAGRTGMRCPSCGYRVNEKRKEVVVLERRDIRGVYTPAPGRVNNLVKPSWVEYKYVGEEKCDWLHAVEELKKLWSLCDEA